MRAWLLALTLTLLAALPAAASPLSVDELTFAVGPASGLEDAERDTLYRAKYAHRALAVTGGLLYVDINKDGSLTATLAIASETMTGKTAFVHLAAGQRDKLRRVPHGGRVTATGKLYVYQGLPSVITSMRSPYFTGADVVIYDAHIR
jgi:hypothetical protein